MLCLDTYALIEINSGNPKFSHLMNEEVVITDVTMAEFYGYLYRKYNVQTADYWHRKLSFLCRTVPREVLIKAVKFRYDNKKKKMSFFDCVGYIYSLDNNMKFVTGDKEFRDVEGVEFIK
jgi:uncharacterized protein